MKDTTGSKIKKHREQKRLTLEAFATLTEISKSYLWALENDNSRKPSAEILARIADNLGVTTSYLLSKKARMTEDDRDEVFIRDYKNLSKDRKKAVRDFVKFLNDDKGKVFKYDKLIKD